MLSLLIPLLAVGSAIAAPLQRRDLSTVVYNCNTNDFAYTWDDGPYTHHNEILDAFDAANSKTTFFMNGDNWSCIYDDDNVAAIRRSFEEGHQVASHTWSHASLTSISYAQIDIEIQRLDEAFVKILGVRPKYLRPPYGDINDAVATYIQQTHGKTIVMWSDDSGDSVGGSVQDSVNFYNGMAAEGPGHRHITLSHETEPSGYGALEQGTVGRLHNAGINMVTVAQCVGTDAYDYIGGYGQRDSSWYCGGNWTPSPPTGPTSTTSNGGGTGGCVTTYTSVATDTCASIGRKYGLSGDAILAANTFLNCNDIWVGTSICIPRGGSTSTTSSTSTRTSTTTSSTAAPTCVQTYTSVATDTCATIGQKFGLTANQILAANTFLNCNDVWVGTRICVPPGGVTSTTTRTTTTTTTTSSGPAPSCVSTYTSVANDTCASIGQKYGLTATQILNANSFLNCNDIWTNTPICIPPGGTPTCTQTYYSVANDTCDSIGQKYGVSGAQIKTWNSFVTCTDIWVGTPLCV